MMTEVACFCGCLYSFDGGAGACPKCGEYATVTTGAALTGNGRSRPEQPVPAMNGAGQNGQMAGTSPEWAQTSPDPVDGIAIGAIARDRGPARSG